MCRFRRNFIALIILITAGNTAVFGRIKVISLEEARGGLEEAGLDIIEGQTLKDKITMDFELDYSPVPFNKVIFFAKNKETGDIIERRSTNIAKSITLSWQTKKLAKGAIS